MFSTRKVVATAFATLAFAGFATSAYADDDSPSNFSCIIDTTTNTSITFDQWATAVNNVSGTQKLGCDVGDKTFVYKSDSGISGNQSVSFKFDNNTGTLTVGSLGNLGQSNLTFTLQYYVYINQPNNNMNITSVGLTTAWQAGTGQGTHSFTDTMKVYNASLVAGTWTQGSLLDTLTTQSPTPLSDTSIALTGKRALWIEETWTINKGLVTSTVNDFVQTQQTSTQTVPVPASLALLGMGLFAMGAGARRRRVQ